MGRAEQTDAHFVTEIAARRRVAVEELLVYAIGCEAVIWRWIERESGTVVIKVVPQPGPENRDEIRRAYQRDHSISVIGRPGWDREETERRLMDKIFAAALGRATEEFLRRRDFDRFDAEAGLPANPAVTLAP